MSGGGGGQGGPVPVYQAARHCLCCWGHLLPVHSPSPCTLCQPGPQSGAGSCGHSVSIPGLACPSASTPPAEVWLPLSSSPGGEEGLERLSLGSSGRTEQEPRPLAIRAGRIPEGLFKRIEDLLCALPGVLGQDRDEALALALVELVSGAGRGGGGTDDEQNCNQRSHGMMEHSWGLLGARTRCLPPPGWPPPFRQSENGGPGQQGPSRVDSLLRVKNRPKLGSLLWRIRSSGETSHRGWPSI